MRFPDPDAVHRPVARGGAIVGAGGRRGRRRSHPWPVPTVTLAVGGPERVAQPQIVPTASQSTWAYSWLPVAVR